MHSGYVMDYSTAKEWKQYDEKMLSNLTETRNTLAKCVKGLNGFNMLKLYDQMGKGRKELVTPVIMTDEMYINFWKIKYPAAQNKSFKRVCH